MQQVNAITEAAQAEVKEEEVKKEEKKADDVEALVEGLEADSLAQAEADQKADVEEYK